MDNKDEYIRSVGRALKILKTFENDNEKSLTEISKECNLAKTTTLRLLSTLEKEGFLNRKGNNSYELGIVLLRLGHIVERNSDLVSISNPIMSELSSMTNETICLNMIIDYKRVCISKIEGKEILRQFVEVGKPTPLYKGSSGKLLLAFMEENEIEYALNNIKNEDENFKANLKKDLDKIKKEGVAYSQNERILGAASISAPVFNKYGKLEAGITISSASIRLNEDTVNEYRKLIIQKANEISKLLGYKG